MNQNNGNDRSKTDEKKKIDETPRTTPPRANLPGQQPLTGDPHQKTPGKKDDSGEIRPPVDVPVLRDKKESSDR